jgi:hypothetical protein
MTPEDKPQQPSEERRPPDQPVMPHAGPEEEELTPLIDKVIAFVLLAIPFSAFLAWIQDLLIERFSRSVAHIVLLIGIVTFLLSLGNVAKRIHRYRTR